MESDTPEWDITRKPMHIPGLNSNVNRLKLNFDLLMDARDSNKLDEAGLTSNAQLLQARALIVIADVLEGIMYRMGE